MNFSQFERIAVGVAGILLLFFLTVGQAQALPAFPGAEGSGAVSQGGRGGRVIEVTNLNNSGAGSLRACVDASGPRTCVFRRGGTIDVRSTLRPRNPFLTIAGQTAPGGGIQLKGTRMAATLMILNTNNIIIQYIKFRKGFHPSCAGGPGNECGASLLWGVGAGKSIADHISVQWTQDESVGWASDGEDSTLSYSLVSEPLAGHPTGWFTQGNKPTVSAALTNIDMHHNLLMNSSHRNPLLRSKSVRVVNNLIYNKKLYFLHASGGVAVDVIGNRFKRGPLEGRPNDREVEAGDDLENGFDAPGLPSIYMLGNIGPNQPTASGNQLVMTCRITPGGGENSPCPSPTTPLPANWLRSGPLATSTHPITAEPVGEVESSILSHVGASRRLGCDGKWVSNRDSVDTRQITQYINNTGLSSSPVTEADVGGFPAIAGGTACADADHDGMPDAYEVISGLNSNNDADRNGIGAGGFTNLENFLTGETGTTPPPEGQKFQDDDRVFVNASSANVRVTAGGTLLGTQPLNAQGVVTDGPTTSPNGVIWYNINFDSGTDGWVGDSTLSLVVDSDTPPTVSITAPAAGATVSGASVAVSASASDNTGVVGVQFDCSPAALV